MAEQAPLVVAAFEDFAVMRSGGLLLIPERRRRNPRWQNLMRLYSHHWLLATLHTGRCAFMAPASQP